MGQRGFAQFFQMRFFGGQRVIGGLGDFGAEFAEFGGGEADGARHGLAVDEAAVGAQQRIGALGGLAGGFAVWAYTLLVPAIARSGWIDAAFLAEGPFGVAAMRPYALFGAPLGDPLTHALVWSMVANLGLFVGLSLATRPSATERIQATRFVEAFSHAEGRPLAYNRGDGLQAGCLIASHGPQHAELCRRAREAMAAIDPGFPL
jgi:hypothetical protein